MKIMHISDLHLGKRVNEFSMLEDQRALLKQIIDTIRSEKIDALMIAGDIYDRSVPSEEAVIVLNDFLDELANAQVTVLMISGNHDSAERLHYGERFFEKSHVYIATHYEDGKPKKVEMQNGEHPIHFYLFPFIKPVILNYACGQAFKTYDEMMAFLVQGCALDQDAVNIAIVHQFIVDGTNAPERSDSETASLGGIDAIDASVFDAFDYVALGHIHKPQAMGRPCVRYSGSLLKYSISEANQPKSMTILDIEEKTIQIKTIPFRPLHDLRVVEGKLEDLRSDEFDLGNRDDYMHVILDDTETIVDAIGKVRSLYPNTMHISYAKKPYSDYLARYKQNHAKRETMTPLEMFADFFALQNGIDMNAKQAEMIEALMEEIDL